MPQMFKRESFASVVTSCLDGCECFTCSGGFDNGNTCLSQVYTLLQTSGIYCSVHLKNCEQKNAALQAQQAGKSFSETSDDDIEVQLAGRHTCVAESPILSSQRKTNKSYNVFSGMSSWNSLANQFSTKVRSNLHECSSSIGCYFHSQCMYSLHFSVLATEVGSGWFVGRLSLAGKGKTPCLLQPVERCGCCLEPHQRMEYQELINFVLHISHSQTEL